jgi:CRP-like cAMP-binding protein
LSLRTFREACADPALIAAFAAHLAQRVQDARARAEILSLKTVQARLDAWLAVNRGALPEKGHWRELAESLSVTPEALYREISGRRMRKQRE